MLKIGSANVTKETKKLYVHTHVNIKCKCMCQCVCIFGACDGESVSVWERLGEQEEGHGQK